MFPERRPSRVSRDPDTQVLGIVPASAEQWAANRLPGPPVAASPAVAEGAPEALERVYEQHFSFVWRSLRALGVDPALLDDAAQEVFLVAHRRSADFERRSSMKTWLFGIANRVAANFRRRARRRPSDPLPDELLSDQPDPEQQAERAETVRRVEKFLNGVDADQRAIFTACVLEGMSVPEAAEALGVNANTLYSRLRLVRSKFSTTFSKRGSER